MNSIMNLEMEQISVLAAHAFVWFYYLDKVWNISGMPASELDDIRAQFASPQVILKPLVLNANSLWRCLLREILLAFCVWALASNYIQSHKSWGVALCFLGFVVVAIEALKYSSCRRYRQDLNFCNQTLNVSRVSAKPLF